MHKSTVFKMQEDSLDPYVQQDVERLANDNSIPWDLLKDKTILITGATGLIGSTLIKAIACRNRLSNSKIFIKAVVRNLSKAKVLFKDILNLDFFEIIHKDIFEPFHTQTDYIIHGASVTSSLAFVKRPVETIWTTLQGTRNILELAKENKILGIAYLSSLEYYGNPKHQYVDENEIGYLIPTSIRSSYSEGKRAAECMCMSYFSEYNVPVKCIRLAQTFGPGVSQVDNRVFAQFAKSIISKENIILQSKGETTRNYCYTTDAIAGILTVLVKGHSGNAYNIANSRTTISILEMAKFVCKNFGEKQSKVIIDISKDVTKLGYNPTIKISLKTDKIESLGWSAKVDLYEMFERTIASMKLKLKHNHKSK